MKNKVEALGGRILTLDVNESMKMYENYKEEVQPNMCYNNMFNLSPYVYQTGWKIAYGYVQINEVIFARHAFITAGARVIDPTIAHFHKNTRTKQEKEGGIYIVLHEFDTMSDYLDALRANGGSQDGSYYVDMRYTLRQQFDTFQQLQFEGVNAVLIN